MYIPRATYRLQLNESFDFTAVSGILKYLSQLNISTVYASPIFRARAGSTHGYDITDPGRLNPELGSMKEFESLIAELRSHGLGWIQDFVPNHMAYDSANDMLMDVFEKGRSSPYYDFFDIVWDHLRENLRWKVIAPFLGGPYGEVLENGEIALQYNEEGFSVRYHGIVYPIRIETYGSVLSHRLDTLRDRLGEDDPDYIKMVGLVCVLSNLELEQSDGERRNAQIRLVKDWLRETFDSNPVIREFIGENIEIINGTVELLDDLLTRQRYRLSYWRVATKEINYQRFFNINDLISLRMEDPAVFDRVHQFALELFREGKIDGLRIDHIDGLYDPADYLRRLRAAAPDAYVVVEKILESPERLPSDWPVQGTTGYEFLNEVNGLFVAGENKDELHRIYSEFCGSNMEFAEVIREKKKLIIERHLTGDLDNLTYVLKRISITTRKAIDLTWIGLKTALLEMSARFPVYRTYITGDHLTDQDERYVREAAKESRGANPELEREINFIEAVLLLQFPAYLTDEYRRLWTSFIHRFQQFTSPLMAKGLEDTAFYTFNRLVSLNEVGGNPERFGVTTAEFHAFNLERLRDRPLSLNATASHDAKRGEDIRARINVLSEIPGEWESHLRVWSELNRGLKRVSSDEEWPPENREYFLYQTLIGAHPFSREDLAEYPGRIRRYLVKSAREAKLFTFWLDPAGDYEEALVEFVDAILTGETGARFLESFLPFQEKVAFYGVFNSLSQTLLKIASPGVPDFYQGTDLWDLNLVDPDNRRPVDFNRREKLLEGIRSRAASDIRGLIAEMLADFSDGRVKLFTIWKALEERERHPGRFASGDYIPLTTIGVHAHGIVAFARRDDTGWSVAAAPRLLTSLVSRNRLPLGEVWGDTGIQLPVGAPPVWTNVFTRAGIEGRVLPAGELFREFPVALLSGS